MRSDPDSSPREFRHWHFMALGILYPCIIMTYSFNNTLSPQNFSNFFNKIYLIKIPVLPDMFLHLRNSHSRKLLGSKPNRFANALIIVFALLKTSRPVIVTYLSIQRNPLEFSFLHCLLSYLFWHNYL